MVRIIAITVHVYISTDLKYHLRMENETFSLLIFHGSALPEANAAAVGFAERLKERIGMTDFSICFLKGVAPELAMALEKVVARGFRKIRLIPLFLLPGTHTRKDIPAAADVIKKTYPHVRIEILDCLVEMPEFLELIGNKLNTP
ncbi:hypothetical protein MASR1M12_40170 [Erysipelotrichia bacterium]